MNRNEFLSHFENVCELFDNISNVSQRTAKEAMLKDYPDREFLKDILLYTYNPFYIYGIDKKTIDQSTFTSYCGEASYNNIFELLDFLKENNTGKEEYRVKLYQFAVTLDDFLLHWFNRIVLKDLKIGVNTETINKIFPKLIPQFKVGLCKTYEDASSLRYENYIVQPKLDGVRIIAICTGGSAELFTRNGMKVEGYDDVIKDLSYDCWKDYVLDGEIMTDNFDGTMEGLFALKQDKKAVYHIFDIMTVKEFKEQKCHTPYKERWKKYESLLGRTFNEKGEDSELFLNYKNLKPVEPLGFEEATRDWLISDKMSDLDTIAREAGYEGLVLKALEAPYEFCTPSKRSWGWVKYKSWHSEEFEVIGMEEGTGKYEGMLGALVVNANGVEVKVGSGFTDDAREFIWNYPERYEGQIAEIKYQEVTKDGSLRFPTFIKFRNDI